MLTLYNSLTKKEEEFHPQTDTVGFYFCGPTVYWTQHIGNMRAFFVMDSIRRVIKFNGYKINHVMNITDVGHMTSDEDEGDDKIELTAKKENKSPEEVANYYWDLCYKDIKKLNIETPEHIVKATSVIDEIIEFIKTLIKNGFAYETQKGVYYDISKFKDYGQLGGMNLNDKLAGARIAVDDFKRNPLDFTLWVKAAENHIMKWQSPWGLGYPGWHIECSAIGRKFLGNNIDIHGGGVEHKTVHHENEIAQNFGVCGTQVVKYWVHLEHLMMDGKKMSKSLKNIESVSSIIEKGYSPLSLRYLYLTAHYSKQQNFTFESLASCETALQKIWNATVENKNGKDLVDESQIKTICKNFENAVNSNLNFPLALSYVWELLKIKNKSKQIYNALLFFDNALGLDLKNAELHLSENKCLIPADITELALKRWQAKDEKNWALADKYRKEIDDKGFTILDKKSGYDILKK
ncbi:MAG: cysteine--tRNA ligase [Clostridia bacterium]